MSWRRQLTILAKSSSSSHGTQAQESWPGAAPKAGSAMATRIGVADRPFAQGPRVPRGAVAEPRPDKDVIVFIRNDGNFDDSSLNDSSANSGLIYLTPSLI